MILGEEEKPQLDELVHYGVKGMHWGVRKDDHPGASRATNKAARRDAAEFSRAKMFYGEGAGTRRKLIKAKVEASAKRNPDYQKAFDHHMSKQDLGRHADKAQSERKRKDVKSGVKKNVRAVNRAVNGPFASSAAAAMILGGYGYAKSTGLDKKVMNSGSAFVRQMSTGSKIDLSFLNK